MNWQEYWNRKATAQQDQEQVGRVNTGHLSSLELLQRIGLRIKEQLDLKPTDSLLDVCCGNGALTHLLLPYCKTIHGVDFSEQLIAHAKRLSKPHLQFTCDSATTFNLENRFDKILLYFSFQYFENYEQGKQVIKNLLLHAKPSTTLLIGDIPDQRKILNYYNSPKRWWSFLKQSIQDRNDMGRFWHPLKLDHICKELGVNGESMQQQVWQPYSHYRFDYLIRLN